MAYQAIVTVQMCFVPDGAAAMSVPGAQSMKITLPSQTMPGGNTVSVANTNTLGTSIGTAAQTALAVAAVQAQLLGWATGGQ